MQYAVERITPELEHEINDMLDAYYKATPASHGIPPYDFDWEIYEFLDQSGSLLITTARDDSRDHALSGVAIYHVVPMPHHKKHIIAECDSISVAHTERGKGIGKALYLFTEPLLVARGARLITNRYRTCYNATPLFEDLGFTVDEIVYAKRIE